MNYRNLGKTGLRVSEVGFGGEWLQRHPEEESVKLMKYAHEKGINIIDCWMPDSKSRDIICCWITRHRSASDAGNVKRDVRLVFRSPSGWRRQLRCSENKGVYE